MGRGGGDAGLAGQGLRRVGRADDLDLPPGPVDLEGDRGAVLVAMHRTEEVRRDASVVELATEVDLGGLHGEAEPRTAPQVLEVETTRGVLSAKDAARSTGRRP